jgi:hypothetical protein
MARIRTIKPEFFTSDDIVALSPLARLLFIGCWCEADREGRLEWKPTTLKRKYLPEDDCNSEEIAEEIVRRGCIVLYGDGLAFIPGFARHQVINLREAQSKYPPPDDAGNARALHVTAGDAHALPAITPGKGKEGKGKEGNTDNSVANAPPIAKRGSRIPDEWALTQELREFASGLGLDPEVTLAEFVDYWRGVPGSRGRKLDWPATFRNRCRELASRPRKSPAPKATPGQTPVTAPEPWEQRLAAWRSKKFWMPMWGPKPGEPGCAAPKNLMGQA